MMKAALAFAALVLSAAPALAGTCDFDSSQPLKAMQVTAAKSSFLTKEGKPAKAYVRQGDEVVVQDGKDKILCSAYISPRGVETDGWLNAADLKPATVPDKAEALLGEWAQSGNTQCAGSNVKVEKGKKPGTVKLDGESFWSQEESKDCASNVGDLDTGDLTMEQGTIHYSDKDPDTNVQCAVDLTPLSGRYMQGDDESALGCWGMNVSFSGLYFKKH